MSEYEVEELFTVPRSRHVLAPGAVHVPDWLDTGCQQQLVTVCREWVRAAPMKHQVMPCLLYTSDAADDSWFV